MSANLNGGLLVESVFCDARELIFLSCRPSRVQTKRVREVQDARSSLDKTINVSKLRHNQREVVSEPANNTVPPRVLAAFGSMVMVSGMERMSFEVLRVLREGGATIHCILNSWENHRIVPLVESVGATWSTGTYSVKLGRHSRKPADLVRMAWEISRVSTGMLRDARRFRPTHVFLPEFVSIIRNAPALLVLRMSGVKVICRLANHPEPHPFYQRLFRGFLQRFTDVFVANSDFAASKVLETGVDPSKVRTIYNTLSTRHESPGATSDPVVELAQRSRTIVSIGQIAPFKGTHMFVEAALRVLPRHEGVQALIVGRKPEWPPERVQYIADLEREIAQAEMSDRIQFIGETEQVPALMAASELLVLPILQEETFGNVALEALAAGLPVVSFATGGLTELVEHGQTGHLCQEKTVDCLVGGIEGFLGNPQARKAAAQSSIAKFNSAESPYSRRTFARNWNGLFGPGAI